MVGLDMLEDGVSASASAMSPNGGFIVGTVSYVAGSGREAFIWDQVNGSRGLGHLGGIDNSSFATAVSADGRVVVGYSYNRDNQLEAFRWTEETGMVGIGFLDTSAPESKARWVSADGEVVYGKSLLDTGGASFRWTAESGMISIVEGSVLAVSGDSKIIGGFRNDGVHGEIAFIWDETNGLRDLRDLLVNDYGVAGVLLEWQGLNVVRGISGDGTKIVGYGHNPNGDFEAFLVDLAPAAPPEITTSPIEATVNTAASTTLSVEATGEGLEYQWQRDGVDVLGAIESTLTIPSAQRFHVGDYTVVVSTDGGSVTSEVAALTVESAPDSDARLTNLSTRAMALSGNDVLIPGFVISGTGTKSLLIRAVGATLRKDPFNIATALEDPTMTLKQWDGSAFVDLATNDNWDTNTNLTEIESVSGAVGAFGLSDNRDSVLLADLGAGQYTVIAGGVGGLTGVAIVELYDADDAGSGTVLTNISNRGFVGTGASIMIPGISVSSEGPKTFLIRAVGPTLGADPFNLPGVLQDPKLTVYDGPDAILANDNWGDNPDADHTKQIAGQLGAFALVDGSKDAAFVVTLPPGSYTIQAAGADGGEGTALVEVYVVE